LFGIIELDCELRIVRFKGELKWGGEHFGVVVMDGVDDLRVGIKSQGVMDYCIHYPKILAKTSL
jgi:hypothetical protein